MTPQFDVVDVSAWPIVRTEPEGRSGKYWLRHPRQPIDSESREDDWLFKPVVIHDNGDPQGGDWSERIVSELAALLGVPCAPVELAVRGGQSGSISRNVTPDRWDLVAGFVWMSARVPGYSGGQRMRGSPGHSLENIRLALAGCDGPPGCDGFDAVGAFAGYLVLDAWVANSDRHERNWAVLRSVDEPGGLRLAPSYDHTSSLGFNLRDAARNRMINERRVAAWAAKGLARQFEHDPRGPTSAVPTLVGLAHQAVEHNGESGAHWLKRLGEIDQADVRAVVTSVPGLSEPTATFILELLETNRRRLLGDG